jgi:hypothetical protein
MKLLISHPELAPALVSALNETDCVATVTSRDTVEVFMPWLRDRQDRQAAMELLFFVRAWASDHPGFRAALRDPR